MKRRAPADALPCSACGTPNWFRGDTSEHLRPDLCMGCYLKAVRDGALDADLPLFRRRR